MYSNKTNRCFGHKIINSIRKSSSRFRNKTSAFHLLPLGLIVGLCSSCATSRTVSDDRQNTVQPSAAKVRSENIEHKSASKNPPDLSGSVQAQINEIHETLLQVNRRLIELEVEIKTITGKNPIEKTEFIHKTGDMGMPTNADEGAAEPGSGRHDSTEKSAQKSEAVFHYQRAFNDLKSKSFVPAIEKWNRFLELYPTHALAGSAQFYLGQSYSELGDFENAKRELQKVLTTYGSSPLVSEALLLLVQSEKKTGLKDAAEKHQELLTSLFPNSPAAWKFLNQPASPTGASTQDVSNGETSKSGIDPPPTVPTDSSEATVEPSKTNDH